MADATSSEPLMERNLLNISAQKKRSTTPSTTSELSTLILKGKLTAGY